MKLIDPNNAIDVLEILADKCADTRAFEQAIQVLESIHTIEAEPVKHSKWIDVQDTSGHHYQRCLECGTYIEDVFFANDYNVNYCPCCGAKMDLNEVKNG